MCRYDRGNRRRQPYPPYQFGAFEQSAQQPDASLSFAPVRLHLDDACLVFERSRGHWKKESPASQPSSPSPGPASLQPTPRDRRHEYPPISAEMQPRGQDWTAPKVSKRR